MLPVLTDHCYDCLLRRLADPKASAPFVAPHLHFSLFTKVIATSPAAPKSGNGSLDLQLFSMTATMLALSCLEPGVGPQRLASFDSFKTSTEAS